jgi:hypothetical protein
MGEAGVIWHTPDALVAALAKKHFLLSLTPVPLAADLYPDIAVKRTVLDGL